MLRVLDLVAAYGKVEVIHGVSLDLQGGECVALVGANGAGKTTLLKALSGLIPARSGKVYLQEKDITSLPPHRIVDMGLIHVPEGRQLFPQMTVEENLLLAASNVRAALRLRESWELVFGLFPRLRERMRQPAGTLSGGEQQMAAIARGLMAHPLVLMLDEPSLGLAPLLMREIYRVLLKLVQGGVTLLLVEQNVRLALKISARSYVMENGRIFMHGQSSELLKEPKIRRAYLGM
jgi:branched-chain amino acid transport system ATP-binding protein